MTVLCVCTEVELNLLSPPAKNHEFFAVLLIVDEKTRTRARVKVKVKQESAQAQKTE